MMKLQKKTLKQYKAQTLFVLLSLLIISCENKTSIFEFTTEKIDKDIVDDLKSLKDLPPFGLLYSDTNYEVWKTCSGEWGGTIYFKNKKSGKIYHAQATCPVSVNKINHKYYISNSMSHLSGNSGILEITDPEKMEQTPKIPLYRPDINTREYESHSSKGTKKMTDTAGTIIMSSFVYKQRLYSILLNYGTMRATISELRGSKLYTIQEIDKDLFSEDPIIIKESETHQKIYLQHPKPGILEIKENKIKFISYTKSKK